MEKASGDWADEAEARVLDAALPLAAELGWSKALVERAAAAAGLSVADAALLAPNGPRDLAALLSRRHDQAALQALGAPEGGMTGKIRRAVLARIEAAAADEAAVRRALAFTVLPRNLPLAVALLWESADALWRWAGDTATDENHYSKRAILSAVLAGTLAARFREGPAAAEAYLDVQLGRVMAFEKWKAKAGPKPLETMKQIAGALARLRYGARDPEPERLTHSPRRISGPSAG
jgi:ubiquinone biosynthesis protein COQ9